MIATALSLLSGLSVLDAVLAVAALLAPVVLAARARRRGPQAEFYTGPMWSWCPVEKTWTPHQSDAGVRHCLSCKTTTPNTEGEPRA